MPPTALTLAVPGTGQDDSPDVVERSRAFHFPYAAAYEIQLDLMAQLFLTIEGGKAGVFESPTGTVRRAANAGQVAEFALQCVYLALCEPQARGNWRGSGRQDGG